jgi:hypothetical protein
LFQGWNMTAENPSENPEIALRFTGSKGADRSAAPVNRA